MNQLHFMAARCGVHLQNKISSNGTNTPLKPCMQSSVRFSFMSRGKLQNMHAGEELGQYPRIIKTQKRAIKFWKHLKYSDPLSYYYQALQCQELSKEKSPLIQLVLVLSSLTCSTNSLKPHSPDPASPKCN